ncbi:MAG: hypothetical protein ACPL7O_12625, partial [Armatimonadota bacterium]
MKFSENNVTSGTLFRYFASWAIIGAANLASLAYFVVRYRYSEWDGIILAIFVFCLSWVAGWTFTNLVYNRDSYWLFLLTVTLGVALVLVLGAAVEKRFLADLVSLRTIDRPIPGYYVWKADGERTTAPATLPLRNFHRQGDETAHLAAAYAIRRTWGIPSKVAQLIGDRHGYDRTYWLARALSGHPPGLAMLYAPFCECPPMARMWAFLIFLLCVIIAYWAGNQWSLSGHFGLLCATCFAFIPNLNWWHMTSVSSDIPPALFTFCALGLIGRALIPRDEAENNGHWIQVAGLLLGLGTFVTFTAALATFGLAALLWGAMPSERRRLSYVLWLLLPTMCAIALGVAYSKIAIPSSKQVLLARLDALLGESAPSPFTDPVHAIVTFVSRWPMDLGMALTVLFLCIPLW